MTAENDTVLIKVELLHINLKLKFLLQISPISKLFNVFLSNFDQGTFFCTKYNTIIRFRRRLEFLPTLPMKYDHCAWICTILKLVDIPVLFTAERRLKKSAGISTF